MLRFHGNDEQQYELADDERENGDNSIIRTNSPTSGSYTKKSSPPMSTPMRIRRHPFISPDEKPPKGMNYMPPVPTKVVTTADAAAVLASLTPPYNNTYINHDKKHSHKYTADDKSSTKQLKHSIDFNHFNRPVSPRQTAQNQPYIDVAEVFATTVSFIRENNKKLDRLSDEVKSEGQSSDNDMDSDDSMDSYQRSSNNGDNEDIVDEIQALSIQLDGMEKRYREQIRGKNLLIEQLQKQLDKSGKELKKKRIEIERLESELEASKRAIIELVECTAQTA